MTSVLAGKKFTPPFKGQAEVEFTKPVTKREKDMVVTTIQVRNTATAPLLRLTIDETWYDKAGGLVTGGKGRASPARGGRSRDGEDRDAVEREDEREQLQLPHANGTVKPRRVDKLVPAADAKEPATKPAAAKKN